eukprot:10575232-Lingulodinium_polyedra.AAC.1
MHPGGCSWSWLEPGPWVAHQGLAGSGVPSSGLGSGRAARFDGNQLRLIRERDWAPCSKWPRASGVASLEQ